MSFVATEIVGSFGSSSAETAIFGCSSRPVAERCCLVIVGSGS